MNNKKLNLQYFANVADIMQSHADAFPEGNEFEAQFGAVQAQLQGLGYDLLINDRKNAEFIPQSRLSEVISQRDGFKASFENANRELAALKEKGGISEEAQAQIDTLISANNTLLESLRDANISLAVVTEFDDAIDPADILLFIDKSKLKIDKDGRVTGGLREEHDRLKSEKPHLFTAPQQPKKAAGKNPEGGAGQERATMNALIRRTAYGRS